MLYCFRLFLFGHVHAELFLADGSCFLALCSRSYEELSGGTQLNK